MSIAIHHSIRTTLNVPGGVEVQWRIDRRGIHRCGAGAAVDAVGACLDDLVGAAGVVYRVRQRRADTSDIAGSAGGIGGQELTLV